MKNIMSAPVAARLAALALIFVLGCADPGDVDLPGEGDGNGNGNDNGNGNTLTPQQADAVLETFSFTSATKVTGTVPNVANTMLTKTSSRDTIYTLPGVTDLIRVSHPEDRPINGVYFNVKGSTFYYDIEVDLMEKSDSVSIVFFEIDPDEIADEIESGWMAVPIYITAYDESREPIDVIERILTIEKPSSDGCNLLEHTWFWEWSALVDPNNKPYNVNAAGEKNKNEFVFKDCCLGVPACPVYDENQLPIYDVEIDIELFYTIATEWLRFYSDGTFYRQTVEVESYIGNPGEDPFTFNPCDWVPEIDRRIETVDYWGTHSYVLGGNTLSYTITGSSCKQGDFGCGFGGSLNTAQLITTCHRMVITRGTAEKSVRMFSRSNASMEEELTEWDTFWE